ncbi:hypothetical protein SIID45300_02389 [Candidatus Magnetaquicoccaceae bacterium FCR-1]|uniref:Uncharacterized protein n=1 Tax=Candidatus Magnetaquiglobus chichijimensis TaxID=3141448 RepID=A0ABQ0CAY6_9PROT
MQADAEAFGITIQSGSTGFEVWEENFEPVNLFLLCATQWRRAGMDGIPVGLDYIAVDAAARMAGIVITPRLFDDVRVMEMAALEAWSGERKHDG